jgi:type I restriction enzyme M protein
LKDEKFYRDVLTNNFPSDKKIVSSLKQTIEDIIEKKHQGLTDGLARVLKNKKLLTPSKDKFSIRYILQDLQKKIFPLISSSNVDVIGEFYHEFLKYSGGDAKGLGIVLTPSHIAELFTELVNLKPTDKVLDICCGTGSFLVASFGKM